MKKTSTFRGVATALSLTVLVVGRASGQAPETIVVNNALDRPVLVWVDGVPAEVVPAAAEKAIGDAPEGVVTLMATDVSTGNVIATEHTNLSEGETFTWTLYLVPIVGEAMGSGTVVLTNGLDRVVEVSLGGQRSAVLAPRATRVLPRVVAGTVDAVAAAPDGTVLATETLTIVDGEVTTWRVGS
jgi:hypothetical protein